MKHFSLGSFAAAGLLACSAAFIIPASADAQTAPATAADSSASDLRLLKGLGSLNLSDGQLRSILQHLSQLSLAEETYRRHEIQSSERVAAPLKRVRTALLTGNAATAEDQDAVDAALDSLKPELGKLEQLRSDTLRAVRRELTEQQMGKLRTQLGLMPTQEGPHNRFPPYGRVLIRPQADPAAAPQDDAVPERNLAPEPDVLDRPGQAKLDANPTAGEDGAAKKDVTAGAPSARRVTRRTFGSRLYERTVTAVYGEPVVRRFVTQTAAEIPTEGARDAAAAAANPERDLILKDVLNRLQHLEDQMNRLEQRQQPMGIPPEAFQKMQQLGIAARVAKDIANQMNQMQQPGMMMLKGFRWTGGEPDQGVSDEEVIRQFFLPPTALSYLRHKAAGE